MTNWLTSLYQTYKITHQIPYMIAVWVPFHLIAFVGILYSALYWSNIFIIYFITGWAVFGGLGAAIMLHRYFAHSSIKIRPILKYPLYWISCMAGQGSPIWWAALHKGYHHAHSDKEKDIHTPTKGFWHAYMGWMFLIKHDTVNLKYAVDLLRDKSLLWFHKNYNKVIWSSILVLFMIDPMLCIWFYIIPSLFALHTDSCVNSFCHTPSAGYRQFETKDLSVNIKLLGLLGWGQGWHNNHHSNPKSFDFGTTVSKKWYEFDMCMLWAIVIAPWSETVRLWKKWYESLDNNRRNSRK